MWMPTTSWPCCLSSSAATDESTPPDTPTATVASWHRPAGWRRPAMARAGQRALRANFAKSSIKKRDEYVFT